MKKHNQNTTHSHNNTNHANRYTKSTNRTDRSNGTIGTNRATKKIANWSEYNKALVSRGNISLLISEDVIKDGHIVPPGKANQVGRPREYSDELIKLALTIRTLFNLALRQTNGYISHLFKLMNLETEVPDYTTLSRRMGKLNLRPYRLINRIGRLSGIPSKDKNKGIVMLVDSSGFKVYGEGEWKVRKHGYSYRRTWRETHIAVDFETRAILDLTNTSAHTHDNTQLIPLLEQVQQDYCSDSGNCSDCNGSCNSKIKTIIGDGAYHARENYIRITREQGIELITPPPSNAVEHLNTGRHFQWYDTPGWEERNRVVRYIDKHGLAKWQANTNYHRRNLVENAFFRLKTIFGERLKSRTESNQLVEQQLKASIINAFNALGLPKYEEIKT